MNNLNPSEEQSAVRSSDIRGGIIDLANKDWKFNFIINSNLTRNASLFHGYFRWTNRTLNLSRISSLALLTYLNRQTEIRNTNQWND